MTEPRQPAPLLGLAIGDSLGGPFETKHFSSQELANWDGAFHSWEINEIQPERKPGEWTDDTRAALALATSLIEAETYNPVSALAKYMEWYESGDHRGMGKTIKQALQRIAQGYHWDQSGILHAEGNGTAMRSAPLGAFYHHNVLTAAHMARIDAGLTHNSDEAREGSAAIAIGVSLLCDGYAKMDVLSPVLALLDNSKVQEGLNRVGKVLQLNPSPADILKTIIQWGTGAHVVQTVPAAFLCFLGTASYQDAVALAIHAGGDTDTTAAITGALSGSFYGRTALKEYLGQLEQAQHLIYVEDLLFELAPEVPDSG